MSKAEDFLILDDLDWYNDYSDKKYKLIHLTIDRFDFVTEDLFLLAASRLYSRGELIVKMKAGNRHQSLLDLASVYEFDLVDSSEYVFQRNYVFRFNGKQFKSGYSVMQAKLHLDDCIALFKEVFGTTMSREFWLWKYPKDKVAHSVVALRNNRVVAHYGFCSRNALYNGSVFGATQACDSMVASSDRGFISSSIFNELIKLGERVFYSKLSPVSIAYGFPHGRQYKLGARLKLFTPISAIWEVIFSIPNNVVNGPTSDADYLDCKLVEAVSSERDRIDVALEIMFSEKDTLLLKRDFQYLLHRYVYHPVFNYEIYRIENCYFIIKVSHGKLFLMDYFGAGDVYGQKLDIFISYLSKLYPGQTLHLWCLDDALSLFINPKKVVDTGAVFVNKRYSSSLPDFKRWWITMGDTDFL